MSIVREEFVGHSPGPHVLITGGVHGDEFEPMAAIRRLIVRFRESPPLRGRITLAPVVNEPAYRSGTRVGPDGLDLARTCPGSPTGSATEQIAHELSTLIRTADFYMDLHTGGTRLRVLPLAGYVLHPDVEILEAQRRMARTFGLPIVWGTDPHLEGRSLSVARDAKIPAIYTEYQGGGECDPAGVDAYVTGCLRVLADVGVTDDLLPPIDAPLVIEDARPGAGHMQVNHPSPCEGFFEPEVTLGQSVREGDPLGTVTDLLGRHTETIRAQYGGLVLVLHTFARVELGTSVAVILPTEEFI